MRIKLLSRAKSQDSKSSSNSSLVFKSPIDLENKEDSHHYHSFDSAIRKLSTEESFFLPKKTRTPEKNIDFVMENESQFIFHEKDILNKRIGDKSPFELDESFIRHSESEIVDPNERAELLDLQENIHTSSHEKNQLDEWSFPPNFLADIPNYVEQSHQTETYRYNDNSFITPSISLEKSVENYMPGRNYNNEELVNRRLDGFAYVLHYIMENGNVGNVKPVSITEILNAKSTITKNLSIKESLENELTKKFTQRKDVLKEEIGKEFALIERLFNQEDLTAVEKLIQLQEMNNSSVSELLTLSKFLEKAKLLRHSENQLQNLEDIEEYIKISESNNFLEQLKAEKATPLGPCLAMTQIDGEAIIGLNGGDKQNTEEKACKTKSVIYEITNEIIKAYCSANVSKESKSKEDKKKNTKPSNEKIDFNKIAHDIQEKLLGMVNQELSENYTHFKEYVAKFADFIATSSYGLNYLKAFMKPFELVKRQEKTIDSNDAHAEVAILDYLVLEKGIKETELYIANNKKACPDCGLAMQLLSDSSENNIIVTWGGTHADDKGSLILPSKSEITSIDVSTESQHKSKEKVPLKLRPIEDLHEARYYIPQFIKASETLNQKFTDKLQERLEEIKSHEKSGEFNKHLTSEHKLKYSPRTSLIEEEVKIEYLLSEYKKSKITQTPQNPWFQKENADYQYTDHDIKTVTGYLSSKTTQLKNENDIKQLIAGTKKSQEISKESRLEIGGLYQQAIREQIKNELLAKELVEVIKQDSAFIGFNVIFIESEKEFDQKQSDTVGVGIIQGNLQIYTSAFSRGKELKFNNAITKIFPTLDLEQEKLVIKLVEIKPEALQEIRLKLDQKENQIEYSLKTKLGDTTSHLFQMPSKSNPLSKNMMDFPEYHLKEMIHDEYKVTINNHFFYRGNDIVKIWEKHLKQINPEIKFYAKHDLEDNYVGCNTLFNDMDQQKESALVLKPDSSLYTNHLHQSVSICGEIDRKGDFAKANLGKIKGLLLAYNADPTHIIKITDHVILFPYHVTGLHWNLCKLQVTLNGQDITVNSINLYEPLRLDSNPFQPLQDHLFKTVFEVMEGDFDDQQLELYQNKCNVIFTEQQYDGALCGAIASENGKEFLNLEFIEKVNIQYNNEKKQFELRFQHCLEIDLPAYNDAQLQNQAYDVSGDLPFEDKKLQSQLKGVLETHLPLLTKDFITIHAFNSNKNIFENNFELAESHRKSMENIKNHIKLIFPELFKINGEYQEGAVDLVGNIIQEITLNTGSQALKKSSATKKIVDIQGLQGNLSEKEALQKAIEESLIDQGQIKIKTLYKGLVKQESNEEFYGVLKTKEGLNLESIKINLDAIIEANQDNAYFYIAPKIMDQEELLSSLSDWQNIPSTYYGALIKLKNESGDKHAVLFHTSKAADHLAITITDPLSQEASTFKLEIENLAQSLRQEGGLIEVVYSGKQNENYGTCADMSLIMLQDFIEQATNKPILDTRNQTLVDNFNSNHINYENTQSHNFDYENYQHVEIAGDTTFFH